MVDAALELVLGRNTGRVDIKETKTNVVGVVGELLNVLGVILLGELNRDNISIKSLDVSRVKIRVAEMRVDLGTVLNTRGGETERKRSPLDVLITLFTLTEGKTLTDEQASSTWMTLTLAFSRSLTSSLRARASWRDWSLAEISFLGKDHLRMVTDP